MREEHSNMTIGSIKFSALALHVMGLYQTDIQ